MIIVFVNLLELFKMSQPAISQHVRKLKDAGLIGETRRGQWIIYSLNKDSDYYPLIHRLASTSSKPRF